MLCLLSYNNEKAASLKFLVRQSLNKIKIIDKVSWIYLNVVPCAAGSKGVTGWTLAT